MHNVKFRKETVFIVIGLLLMTGFGSIFGNIWIVKADVGDIVYTFATPGSSPRGLAWDGTYLWHYDVDDNKIYKLTTSGTIISSFNNPLSTSLGGIAWDGNCLWLSNHDFPNGCFINRVTTTGVIIDSFFLPGLLIGGLDWDGTYLWVAERDIIYKVTTTGTIVDSFNAPDYSFHSIAWDGAYFWISSSYVGKIHKVSAYGEVLSNFDSSATGGLTWDGSYLWGVDSFSDIICKIDVNPDTDPPTPNPSTWESYPDAGGSASQISMTATQASDPSGGIEYYFEETTGHSGGSDSGWQSSRSYTDMELQGNTQYTYRVRTRDIHGNTGSYSSSQSATTQTEKIKITKLEVLNDVQIDYNDDGWNNDGDIFWKMNLGNDIVTIDRSIADIKAGSFKIKATVEHNFDPSWTPKVEYSWSLQGKTGSDIFNGMTGEISSIETPSNVGKYTLSITFTIKDNANQVKWSKQFSPYVYVTYGTPLGNPYRVKNLVRPSYVELATRWAVGLSDDDEIVKTITEKINTEPEWTYKGSRYQDNYAHSCIITEAFNPSDSPNQVGSCGAFYKVLVWLCGTLGVNVGQQLLYNTRTSELWVDLNDDGEYDPSEDHKYTGSHEYSFLTKPVSSLDGNPGNAYSSSWSNRDKWVFHDHVMGIYNGKYYDPTFRLTNQGFSGNPWQNIESLSYFEFCYPNWKDENGDGEPTIDEIYPGATIYALCDNTEDNDEQKITYEEWDGLWGKWIYEPYDPTFSTNDLYELDSPPSQGSTVTDYFNSYGLDDDNNGLYDYLVYDIQIDVSFPGYYYIGTTLLIGEDMFIRPIQSSLRPELTRFEYYENGLHDITFEILGKDINGFEHSNIYKVGIFLKDENGTLIDNNAFNTSFYDYNDFQGLLISSQNISDYGTDTGSDGLFDYLTTEIEVQTEISGEFTIGSNLFSINGEIIDTTVDTFSLSQGANIIQLNLNGTKIYQKRMNGSYNLSLWLSDGTYQESNAYVTTNYNYADFQRPGAYLTETFSDHRIDTDGNGNFDYLLIDCYVEVDNPGNYQLIGTLKDYQDNEITSTITEEELISTKLDKITLSFNGSHIYEHGIDGPYTLKIITLLNETGEIIDSLSDCYTTAIFPPYHYYDFDIPPTNAPGIFVYPNGPLNGVVHTTYSFTTIGVDPDDDMIQYGWDMNGDQIVDDWTRFYDSGEPTVFNYTWHSPGDYAYNVKVADIYNVQSDWSLAFPIHIDSPPRADFMFPLRVYNIFEEIQFNDTSFDIDGNIVSWEWGFGDGNISTIQHPIYNYSNEGDYNVCLTVTDDWGGMDTYCKIIHVMIPPDFHSPIIRIIIYWMLNS